MIKNNKIVTYVKKKDFSRITLTLRSINNSNLIFLWAPGKEKLKLIKKILLDKKKNYPVSFLKKKKIIFYSTVTDFAKFLGLSISRFFNEATW